MKKKKTTQKNPQNQTSQTENQKTLRTAKGVVTSADDVQLSPSPSENF